MPRQYSHSNSHTGRSRHWIGRPSLYVDPYYNSYDPYVLPVVPYVAPIVAPPYIAPAPLYSSYYNSPYYNYYYATQLGLAPWWAS